MILPIYIYGSTVLREKTEAIDSSYEGLDQLIADMYDTMYNADGIGLAAPQVGRAIRLMVVDADPVSDDHPECKGFKRVFINPTISNSSQEECSESEGCLSIPGISEKVSRPKEIEVEYLDANLAPCKEILSGFAARVFLHEYDHIDQVLFVDRISPLRKRMIKTKLQKLSKGQFSCSYRAVLKK